ncbi:MAG TPA: zinc ABC transporter substrate-binding protein, partial [Tepidisphaeraceae bacterium]|nr:zinc ABC transporter substrate-binding protein [Tepidisphaeraceae bacterium]
DAWARTEIASIPASHRKLVTSHDAFGYFGARYDIAVCQSALESVTTEAADPSAQAMAAVVDQIKAEKIPVIFMEATQSPRLIDQVASAAQVKVGPPLYSDSLGRPGSPGDTYIKMIQYNVRSIINALQ